MKGRNTSGIDQLCRRPLQIIWIDLIPSRYDTQRLKSISTYPILDHFLAHHKFSLITLSLELSLVVDTAAVDDDRVRAC